MAPFSHTAPTSTLTHAMPLNPKVSLEPPVKPCAELEPPRVDASTLNSEKVIELMQDAGLL